MSSVSAVTSNANQYQVCFQNLEQQQQDFSQLMDSLRSGDLSGAQQACTIVIQDIATIGQTQTAATGVQADLDALGQAIRSGDTDATKTAYAKLQQDRNVSMIMRHL